MALLTCPDCQHQVSDLALTCPGCGRPRLEPGPATRHSPDLAARAVWQLNEIRAYVAIVAWIIGISAILSLVGVWILAGR